MYLTKNFKLTEFDCPCCSKARYSMPFVESLQSLRDYVGSPIRINSSHRCPKHNLAVGGHPNSMHRKGRAADIVINGFSVLEMYEAARKIPAFSSGGMGLYSTFLHVDNRSQRGRWGRLDGEYVSFDIMKRVLESRND